MQGPSSYHPAVSTHAIPDFVATDLARLGIEPAGDDMDRLARYLDLLMEANSRFNLTGVRDRDEAWRRHIIDSLTLMPMLSELGDARVIDVGAGGGLPGIPLAIALPGLKMTLMDSTGKKVRFLESCIAELGLSQVTALQARAEDAAQKRGTTGHREQYDAVICRAVGPMNVLLELTLPFLKLEGWLFAMKGPSVQQELDAAGDALTILGAGEVNIVDAYPEDFDIQTVIVCVQKERETPKAYPRLPGTPKMSPL